MNTYISKVVILYAKQYEEGDEDYKAERETPIYLEGEHVGEINIEAPIVNTIYGPQSVTKDDYICRDKKERKWIINKDIFKDYYKPIK